MTKIWKYLFSYDSQQRNDQRNGQILRFPHISKYLSLLFARFWLVDMPDIWFWVSRWVLILVTVTSNGLVIYFIVTKPRRQILLHRRPSFCFPSSLTITIRHLPCSWKYPECSFSRFCPSLSLSLQLLISFALAGKSPPDQGTDCSSPPQPCYEHEWTEHPATCSIQSATREFHRLDHIGDDRLQYHVPRRELPLSLLSHQFMSLRWDAQIYGLSGADCQHCCQSSSLFLL